MDPKEKLLILDRALVADYGETFTFFSESDPLSSLIGTMLSHRTKNRVTKIAYNRLKETFPDWESVRDAETSQVEEAIAAVTYPEQKAPRIQEVLRIITEEREGDLSLDFLAEWPVVKAREWLERLPGVGAKSSAATLNFSCLHLPALVVDMHHLRVAQRTGIIPMKMGIAKGAHFMQSLMPDKWDGQRVYDHHQRLMRHGQKVCFWKNPLCGRCSVRQYCDYYHNRQDQKVGSPESKVEKQ